MPSATNQATPSIPGVQPLEVVMLIYPGMTMLDVIGPQNVLGLAGRTHLIWKSLDPVVSDTGVSLNPSGTFATCPRDVDVLFVPGATNNNALMQDEETLAFLREFEASARYITSVCTGSLLLGAAGLLKGYSSTCHWAYMDILRDLGIEASNERVHRDRNRFSGGGVTAGIDFGLTLLSELRGEELARTIQLGLQYSPEPPFVSGLPHEAGPEITRNMLGLIHGVIEEGREIARNVSRRNGSQSG